VSVILIAFGTMYITCRIREGKLVDKQYIDLVTKKAHSIEEGLLINELDERLIKLIKSDFPNVSMDSFISQDSLMTYRLKTINRMLENDSRTNTHMHKRFKKLQSNEEYQEVDVQATLDKTKTLGTHFADIISKFGGSWTFILIFLSCLMIWIILNVTHVFGVYFDPYPFILLNLALSMIAAIQAPIIMMSQNRAADYDRMSSKNDYKINKKSELEIRLIHSKLDHLIQKDQPNIMEVQKIQTEMLSDIYTKLEKIELKDKHSFDK
jgi:uncharacterized membrane protein